MKVKSLTKKVITCFVAALAVIALLFNIFNTGANIPWYPAILSFYISVILALCSLISAFVWHNREKRKNINSQTYFAILHTIVRYTLAFNISVFGWAKVLGVQFHLPESISSQPMNQQSGEFLTWYYFGRSYTFNLILAFVQIFGSTLLLFRKTVLLGSIILFALMANITLINIFYQVNFGALLMSILITIGITFLILLDYSRLVAFFFYTNSNLSSLKRSIHIKRNIFWFSAILLSLFFVLYLKTTL